MLNHMATPARFAEAMRAVCGIAVTPDVLRVTELRLAGNAQVRTLLPIVDAPLLSQHTHCRLQRN